MLRPWVRLCFALGVGCLMAASVLAHSTSTAYLWLNASSNPSEPPTVRIDLPLTDLDRALWLDRNHDGEITWAEVQDRWADIHPWLQRNLTWHLDEPCTIGPASPARLAVHSDGVHASMTHAIHCSGGASRLPTSVDYQLFAVTNADHRGLLRTMGAGSAQHVVVLSPGAKTLKPLSTSSSVPATLVHGTGLGETRNAVAAPVDAQSLLRDFFMQGLAHIAVGADHILFLGLLIVGCVLQRQTPGWTVHPSRSRAMKQVLVLVTTFTLAHSLSLALIATGWVQPPSAWVEVVIALSVLITACDNLRPLFNLPRGWPIALFGLAHGFGFGAPLQDLGLQGRELLLPLLGFNLGVEAGQLLMVAWALPLVLVLATQPWYMRRVVTTTSALAALAATYWLIERVQTLF